MGSRIRDLLFALSLVVFVPVCAQAELEFLGEDVLPEVRVNGKVAHIHSQGLFVTEQHYWITGRLDSAKPRRALLMRFPRGRDGDAEVLDITPDSLRGAAGEMLDHPGGFDVDAEGRFWIPVSTSHRRGPTLIACYRCDEDRPLSKATLESSFRFDDHVGALCHDRDESIFGANWDTKVVRRWRTGGKLIWQQNQSDLFAADKAWRLAVQDWKWIASTEQSEGEAAIRIEGLVVAGGLDKSAAAADRAQLHWLDLSTREIVRKLVIPQRPGVKRAMTNEGMAIRNDVLFLQPEDIGAGARVLKFSLAR